ncbi:MAG: hypothetical protein A2506_00485 [Elusimicrobia bacterium RIFOXYD12_FULL_66_9]|nr:MAG: hypothetical protein A2506_00485 [Elusimicrobia bacterium RIFOXYD12_FULL_66_9]
MRFLLLALTLATPAAAEPPGRAAQRARALVDALPAEARVELRKMYFRYADAVSRRLDQGWRGGVLSKAVIEDIADPFQPARLLEEAASKRRKEISDLEVSLSKLGHDRPDYAKTRRRIEDKKVELRVILGRSAREKGICRDWSDVIWSELTALGPEHWTVEDRRRESRPFHTGAVLCSIEEDQWRSVCLVFDPWEEGRADAFAFEAWDAREPGGRIPVDYFMHDLPEKAL